MSDRTSEHIGQKNEKLNQKNVRIADLEAEVERLRDTLQSVLRAVKGRTYSIGEFEVYQPQIDVDRVTRWEGALNVDDNQSES